MANYTSIKEVSSYEDSEIASSKLRLNQSFGHDLSLQGDPQSMLSVNSNKSSPELKRCSVIRSDPYHSESQLITVLKKTERNVNEAILIYKHVKNFDFFKNFKEQNKHLHTTDALIHLCKVLKYETFPAGAVIYRKDDKPDQKVYIIFSGKVMVDNKKTAVYGTMEANPRSLKRERHVKTMTNICFDNNDVPREKIFLNKQKSLKKQTQRNISESELKTSGEGHFQDADERRSNQTRMQTSPQGEEITRIHSKIDIKVTSAGNTKMEKGDSLLEISLDRKLTYENLESRLPDENTNRGNFEGRQGGEMSLSRVHSDMNTSFAERGILKTSESIDGDYTTPNARTREAMIGGVLGVMKPILKKEPSRPESKVLEDIQAVEDPVIPKRRLTRSLTTSFLTDKNMASKPEGLTELYKGGNKIIAKNFKNVTKFSSNKSQLGSELLQFQEHTSEGANHSSIQGNISNFLNASLNLSQNMASSMRKVKEEDEMDSQPDLDASTNSIENNMNENPEIKSKGVFQVRKAATFGESVLVSNDLRTETVAALSSTKVISFTTSDYDYITTRFERTNTKRLNFLLDHVPELEKAIKYDKLKNVDNYFQEQTFDLHSNITVEGEKGKNLYLLYEGVCKVFKESFHLPSNVQDNGGAVPVQRANIISKNPICLIQKGVFIGEEILYPTSKTYEYTVKASSAKVHVLAIKKDIFKKVMPFEVLKGLKILHINKRRHHDDMLERKLKISNTLSFANPSKHFVIKQHTKSEVKLAALFPNPRNPQKSSNCIEKDNHVSGQTNQRDIVRSKTYDKGTTLKSMPLIADESQQVPEDLKLKKKNKAQNSIDGVEEGNMATNDEQPVDDAKPSPLKAWSNSNSGPYLIGSRKFNFKYQASLVQLAEDQKQKIKTEFAKFSRKNALEGVFLNNISVKNHEDALSKAKESSLVYEKMLSNNAQKLPKIDGIDIDNFRFDFGAGKSDRNKRGKSENREKLAQCLSKSSREVSPKGLKDIINVISPKKSSFLLRRFVSQPKIADSLTNIHFSPKQSMVKERTTSIERPVDKMTTPAAKANTLYSVSSQSKITNTTGESWARTTQKAKTIAPPLEKKKAYQIAQMGYSPRKGPLEILGVDVGILGPNIAHFATPRNNNRKKTFN